MKISDISLVLPTMIPIVADLQGRRYGVVLHQHESAKVCIDHVASTGAMVIAVADSLRFGDMKAPWVHQRVVAGFADEVNRQGIPTIAGDVYYDLADGDKAEVMVVALGVGCGDGLPHHATPVLKDMVCFARARNDGALPCENNEALLTLLAHENIASRAPIFEQYDKQIQGRTVLEAGGADAGVMQPFNDEVYPAEIRQIGIALSLDRHPLESIRNVVAVGATPLAVWSYGTMAGCLGMMSDVASAITYDLKRAETTLLLVGDGILDMQVVQNAMQQGFVLSAHDISDGGIVVTLAEMSFKRQLGVRVDISGETDGFILEVANDKLKNIRTLFVEANIPLITLGRTTAEPRLQINGVIDLAVSDAKAAWDNGLRKRLV